MGSTSDRSKVRRSERTARIRASVEQSVANYYSQLSVKDRVEQREWADFAFLEFEAVCDVVSAADRADNVSGVRG